MYQITQNVKIIRKSQDGIHENIQTWQIILNKTHSLK